MTRWQAWVVAAVVLSSAPGVAHGQLFIASRPDPDFTIGPLFVRASVRPELGPVTVDVLWSLVFPPKRPAVAEQDLYLLWPTAVTGQPDAGRSDPELARYVEARGFAVIDEGRLALLAQSVQQMGRDLPPDVVPGGAPFVTFVRQGGPLGLTAPATYIRIPWTPKLASRDWMMVLRLTVGELITAKKANWIENAFGGPRHLLSLSFHDVRNRALFPLYFEHRHRVIRLADEPSQLLVNFAGADHLKIDDVSPPSASRRLSESLDNTLVVSHFLDQSDGLSPQVLTVQFAYFSGLQAWAPILIPMLFFILGNLAAVLARTVADRLSRRLAGHVQFGRSSDGHSQTGVILSRDTLARIAPGTTTYDQVLQLCGPDAEQLERLGSPARRTLLYRGRRVVPQRRWKFGWFATVSRWHVELHEVEIELEQDVVSDVRAHVRRTRLAKSESP